MVCLLTALELSVRSVTLPSLSKLDDRSSLVYAADGELLNGFQSQDDKWRLYARSSAVDPRHLERLLAYEDQNFYAHRGVDFLALARAGLLTLREGRVVSGGSTLTMQLVRLLDPSPRTVSSKLRESLRAIKLERVLSKEQILDAYLTLAPYGGNLEGIRAASLTYFGKEPTELTLEQSALLVALPQAPETRRPDRAPKAALAARNHVLSTLARRSVVAESARLAAAAQPLGVRAEGLPRLAPHLALRLKPTLTTDAGISTLLDKHLQTALEQVARTALRDWEPGVNIAIIVMRNSDGAVICYVGSGDQTNESRQGHVDLVRSIRSPGSALKPFIYAMAFEKLLVHPDTIVADQPIDIAGYRPANADGEYAGDISIRQALLLSKNTVPVLLMDKIGVPAFLARFRTVGSPLRLGASDSEAGLAVALGGVGVSLEQLVWMFSAFANEGELKRLRFATTDPEVTLGDLFEPAAANAVADILADVPPPAGRPRLEARDGSRRVGFKTGTSYGFRDAWTVGFDRLHTVGVWIGRPDGAPLLGAYGVTVAAPLVMRVFEELPVPATGAGAGRKPLGALASPRDLPPRLRRFGPPLASVASSTVRIEFPKTGTEIVGQRGADGTATLPMRVSGGRPPYDWTIEGEVHAATRTGELQAAIAQRGQIEVLVRDADGKQDQASFWLD
ncbi:penicillin-binding protein 1C [Mesorhizobium sp. L103C120A0]|nr:penicillin-binding protein 1C [Mesorhizobium sp. L103C120A0]